MSHKSGLFFVSLILSFQIFSAGTFVISSLMIDRARSHLIEWAMSSSPSPCFSSSSTSSSFSASQPSSSPKAGRGGGAGKRQSDRGTSGEKKKSQPEKQQPQEQQEERKQKKKKAKGVKAPSQEEQEEDAGEEKKEEEEEADEKDDNKIDQQDSRIDQAERGGDEDEAAIVDGEELEEEGDNQKNNDGAEDEKESRSVAASSSSSGSRQAGGKKAGGGKAGKSAAAPRSSPSLSPSPSPSSLSRSSSSSAQRRGSKRAGGSAQARTLSIQTVRSCAHSLTPSFLCFCCFLFFQHTITSAKKRFKASRRRKRATTNSLDPNGEILSVPTLFETIFRAFSFLSFHLSLHTHIRTHILMPACTSSAPQRRGLKRLECTQTHPTSSRSPIVSLHCHLFSSDSRGVGSVVWFLMSSFCPSQFVAERVLPFFCLIRSSFLAFSSSLVLSSSSFSSPPFLFLLVRSGRGRVGRAVWFLMPYSCPTIYCRAAPSSIAAGSTETAATPTTTKQQNGFLTGKRERDRQTDRGRGLGQPGMQARVQAEECRLNCNNFSRNSCNNRETA